MARRGYRWTEADIQVVQARTRRRPANPPQPSARRGGVGARKPKRYSLIDKQPNITKPILINILGLALQDRFPGTFAPNPTQGMHWASTRHKVGVNICGWVMDGSEQEGWRVLVFTPREIVDAMAMVLERVRANLKEYYD